MVAVSTKVEFCAKITQNSSKTGKNPLKHGLATVANGWFKILATGKGDSPCGDVASGSAHPAGNGDTASAPQPHSQQ